MPPVADAGTDVRGIDQVRQRAAASAKAAPARPSSADRSLLRSAGPRPKTPVLGFGSSAARPVTANVGTPQRDAPPKSPYLAHSALKKPSSILDTPSAARNVSTPGTNARPSSAPRRATDSSVLPRRAASPTVQPRRASSPSVPARRLPQVSSTPPRVFEQLLTAKPPVPQLRLTSTPSAPAATSTAAALARTSSAPPSVPAVPKLNLSSVILPDDGPAPDQHKLLCPSSQQQQQQHVGAAPSSAASSLDPSPQRKAAAASSVAAGKARPKAKGSSSHAGPKPPTPQPPPPAPVEEDKSSFYLYPTTTPEERKRVEALLKSLPEKQRAEVGRLWSGLCEARQNCEQMAFRGHRMLDQMKNEFARWVAGRASERGPWHGGVCGMSMCMYVWCVGRP